MDSNFHQISKKQQKSTYRESLKMAIYTLGLPRIREATGLAWYRFYYGLDLHYLKMVEV